MIAFLIYLSCVVGGIAHVAYGALCAALKGPGACAVVFAPFESWQSTGLLVCFLLIFSLATFSMVNQYVTAAPKAQALVAFGAGWALWGLISPFLA